MTSPSVDTEAASTSAPMSASEKAADFEKFLDLDEDEEAPDEGEDGAEEGDDLELDDEAEQDDEDDEPETAIDAPASLNAEEKKAFAAASPEAQQAWAASETRRNTQVQEATTKAAERERTAGMAMQQAEAHAEQKRAAQLKAFIEPYRPIMPHPQLAQTDPASYIAEKAQYDYDAAQFAEHEQHIESIQREASFAAAQIDEHQRVADLMTVGKLADPVTRDEYVKASMELVAELGLDPAAFEQVAGSEDFKALEKIAEMKAKADKYDKAMARTMSKVRSGKGRNLRPSAAPHDKSRSASQSWQKVTGAKNKTAQADAMADWLESSGHL